MRIIVDMDEVLVQFVDNVLAKWNAERGTQFKRSDVNTWMMEDTLGPGSFERITQWLNEPTFFENLAPFDGAVTGFNELRRLGHDVVIATSLAADVANGFDSKRRWVKKFFPDFDQKNFICTSRKELLDGDVLIDDAAHYLKAWHEHAERRSIVVDAPWNKEIDFAVRVANWSQIVSVISAWSALDEYTNAVSGRKFV